MTADQLKLLDDLLTETSLDSGPVMIPSAMWAALLAARETVASLPRTADGVPVTPGMVVWERGRGREREPYPRRAWDFSQAANGDWAIGVLREPGWIEIRTLYSTEQAAALAAGKGE